MAEARFRKVGSSRSQLTIEEKGAVQKFLRKTDDFTVATDEAFEAAKTTGGCLTISVFGFLIFYLCMELWNFVIPEYDKRLGIVASGDKLMQINLDIHFHDVPCDYMELSVFDAFGYEKVEHGDETNLWYIPVTHDGMVGEKFYTQDEIDALEEINKMEDVPDYKRPDLEADWKSTSDQFKHNNFEQAILLHEFTFVLFYADWCSHCRVFHPTWNLLAEQAQKLSFVTKRGSKEPVKILKINCVDFEKACRDAKIDGYPTLNFYARSRMKKGGGGDKKGPIEYQGKRTVEDLVSWLQKTIKKVDQIGRHYQFKSGCQVIGHLEVPRVPGEFRVELNSKRTLKQLNPKTVDLSHTVNHLSFGDLQQNIQANEVMKGMVSQQKHNAKKNGSTQMDAKQVGEYIMYFNLNFKTLPLEISSKINPMDQKEFKIQQFGRAPEHHLKISSVEFDDHRVYTMTMTNEFARITQSAGRNKQRYDIEHFEDSDDEGAPKIRARFNYDLSPLSVKYEKKQKTLYEFTTKLLGLLGGLYTAAKNGGRHVQKLFPF